MSIVNIGNLTSSVAQKIDSSSSELDLLTYAKVIEKLKTGAVCSTASFLSLPSYIDNIGSLYFVETEETIYFANAAGGWIPLKDQSFTELYSWGCNQASSLITGNCIDYSSPVREYTSTINWCFITSRGFGVNGLKDDGTLWSWGRTCGESFTNQAGPFTSITSPVREYTNSLWAQVKRGPDRAHAIKTDGTLWGSGQNLQGDVGSNEAINKSSPVQEASSSSNWAVLGSPGAIKDDGTLWMWGMNSSGQVGVNDVVCYSSPVQEASSSINWCGIASNGVSHRHAIKSDGTLWSWGFNNCGQLAVNDVVSYSSPVQETSSSTNWCFVSTGVDSSSVSIKSNGEMWLWGNRLITYLAGGSTLTSSSPVQEISSSTNWCLADVNQCHGAAIKTDGTLWSWGRNCIGTIGNNETSGNYSSPIQEITSSSEWCIVALATSSTRAIKLKSL